MITQAELKARYSYDPETGLFTCKIHGKPAGTINGSTGYVFVNVHNKRKRAHHLACLYMTGEFPADHLEIDHINQDRTDNRWANLRVVNHAQNQQNQSSTKLNWDLVEEIRKKYKKGSRTLGAKALARKYDVHFTTIQKVVSFESWKPENKI